MSDKKSAVEVSFNELLTNFKQTLQSVFYDRYQLESFIQSRGFPSMVLRDIMAHNPFSAAIPKEYGGRGAIVKEVLGLMSAASYESLPLSLTFGINMSLFLQPVAKYADDTVKKSVFNRFLTQQNMGGLMITEPDHGSDALNMQTENTKTSDGYKIKGTKHWQGLTGLADYWLISSRNKNENGRLSRDIDFFVCDAQQKNQHIEVEEYYNNMGLYLIPYGKNKVDIEVPNKAKLIPESTGIKLMLDLLHRSRFHFPGMGMGFIQRMLDEAIKHCSSRIVGGKPLISFDQVKFQISKIQSAFTTCSAMCSRSSEHSSINTNLVPHAIEANCMKAYVTDLMQESAQTLTQLSGANGYKAESFGTRSIVDSRPFQVFEGSNEMLYSQVSEMVLKLMQRKKELNLSQFLKSFHLTELISDRFKSSLDFIVELNLPQRKSVEMGKIISRVVGANWIAQMADKGFNPKLVTNALEHIQQDIASLVASYQFKSQVVPIVNYKEQGNWLDFTR